MLSKASPFSAINANNNSVVWCCGSEFMHHLELNLKQIYEFENKTELMGKINYNGLNSK